MKRFITLLGLFCFLCNQLLALDATPPAYASSNLSFNSVDGASLAGAFNIGAGSNRIIVMKEGSPVQGLPANGVDYTGASSNFGTAGAAFTAAGEYVVARTSGATFTVNKLKSGTTYYVAIFEFNGTGAATAYLMTPLAGNQPTVSAPATQTFNISVASKSGKSVSLSWSAGNGSGRIVLCRKAAPVNVVPQDLTLYTPSDIIGSGSTIGDNYVVFKGSGNSVNVKGLDPNTTYHFSFFEYNGNSTPVHLLPGATFSVLTNAGPDVPAGTIAYTNVEGNRMRVTFPAGNGSRRLVIGKKGSAVTAVPVNGLSYTSAKDFANPSAEIVPGEFVVSEDNNTFVDVTNLEPNAVYYFRVYEYDRDVYLNTYYLTSVYSENSGSTASSPNILAKDIKVNSYAGASANIGFTVGNGKYRMVAIREGAPVSAKPADLSLYTGGAYKSGTEIAPDNYCIVAGTNGNTINATGLERGKTYHIAIFEFNGSAFPVYAAAGAPFQFTMPLEPTSAANSPAVQNREGASFRFLWNKGTGARRLVIAKKATTGSITARPADFVSYTANNNYAEGEQIVPGEYVVYDGVDSYFDLKKLESGTSYELGVFEYNVGADGKPDYLTSAFLSATLSTVSKPTAQAKIMSITNVEATKATVNIDKGSGENRLFVVKKNASVGVHPQDLTKYVSSSFFGTSSSNMGDDSYVVAITNGVAPFTITGLQPGTTYYINGYEFNGNQEPVYLQSTPATASFTTADLAGPLPPTAPASNDVVEDRDGNKFTLKWNNGDGAKRIVVMKAGSSVSFVPDAGLDYPAEAEFGTGADLGGGQFVVFNGTGSSVEVRNLDASTTYHFRVYEYNGTGTLIRYLTTGFLESTAATATAPTTMVTGVQVVPATGSLAISWTNSAAAGRLVVVKEGSAVTGVPMNYTAYPANVTFKLGAQLLVGEFVVLAGAGNSVTVTGLDANKMYHYSIFEYNGIDAPVYNTTAVQGSAQTSAALPVNLVYFRARQVNGDVLLSWATAQESNNESFTIERSNNGLTFESVKVVRGSLNSDRLTEYNYKDESPSAGKLWYRLKQTDRDGDFSYSRIVVVDPGSALKQFHISPNPANDLLRIDWPGNATEASVVVYSASGVLVKQEKLLVGRSLSLAGLTSGTYYLTVYVAGQRFSRSVIKS